MVNRKRKLQPHRLLSVIDTDLILARWPSNIRIAHSIITGGRIGIDIRNVSAASVDRVLEAEIVDNESSRKPG